MYEKPTEIVVISGKGGTGKTSITASLAVLAQNKIMADCDVDAADLHLILSPEIISAYDFEGSAEAIIHQNKCTHCGVCIDYCEFDAISEKDNSFIVNSLKCEGCNVCAHFCPSEAIEMKTKIAGQWYVSSTEKGPMVHAALGTAEDNSGKLVSKVREISREVAKEKDIDLIIIDGPPGIGCAVIASIAGSQLVVIVTEPTVSGLHDLKRVVELIKHFHIKAIVCINKSDLNLNMVAQIEEYCSENEIKIAAQIPYDIDFTKAQIEAKSLVEYSKGIASQKIYDLWNKISEEIKN